MPDEAWVVALLAVVTFHSAWREYAGGNRRDAGLLSAVRVTVTVAVAVAAAFAWLV